MKYEKPQKKNPHRITVNQHVFPAKCIERFADDSGTVEVKLITKDKIVNLRPDDSLFCAKRCWDQRAEAGYMKEIEDSFQNLATEIISNKDKIHLEENDNWIATKFFALWYHRAYRNTNPIQDTQLKGIAGGEQLSKNEEELLETKNVVFARGDDAVVPGRFMNGINIQMAIDRIASKWGKLKWGIISSIEDEFIVPETFSSCTILPISPKIILLGDSENLIIPKSWVIQVNKLAISFCRTYYFARKLSNCPIKET
jgi:hypothetical protein